MQEIPKLTEEDSIKDENKSKNKLRPKDLEIAVELVKDFTEQQYFDAILYTYLGFKDHSSYLIGDDSGKVKVIDKANLIHSGELPGGKKWIRDIIYSRYLNCYFLASRDMIYRKDIDDRTAYAYIDINCGHRGGSFLRYSELNKRLIVAKDCQNISVINPKTKKLEVEMKIDIHDEIEDFRVFGKKENRVIALTKEKGYVLLYSLYHKHSRGLVGHYQISLTEERSEILVSVSVCQKNRYVLVEIGSDQDPSYVCSRVMIFKLSRNTLTKMGMVDSYKQKIGWKYGLECFGHVGRHLLWVGLSWNLDGPAQVYVYNKAIGELRELEEKRVLHQQKNSFKLHRSGNKFYYSGRYPKLMSLRVSF